MYAPVFQPQTCLIDAYVLMNLNQHMLKRYFYKKIVYPQISLISQISSKNKCEPFFLFCLWFFVFIIIKKMLVYIISSSRRVLFMLGDFLEFCFFLLSGIFLFFFPFFQLWISWMTFLKIRNCYCTKFKLHHEHFSKNIQFLNSEGLSNYRFL